MIRKAAIMFTALLATAILALWIASYWYVVSWLSRPHTQLPVVSFGIASGSCTLARMCHVNQVPRNSARGFRLAGFSVATGRIGQLMLGDDPAGITIRRIKPIFGDGGTSPFYGDLRFVTMSDVELTQVSAPAWFLFVLAGAYPTLAFVRGPLRRHRRQRKGLCVACGYDLTGNVSGACPECGRPT